MLLERGAEELGVEVSPEARDLLLGLAGGDGRRMLNALEVAAGGKERVEPADVERAMGSRGLRYGREEHYDVISAFIKSVRGGDPDAALHYLARMLEAGEDPVFVARRLVILASEDIGNADPHGLPLAMAAAEAVQLIGMPEGRIPLAQATTYLASTPKSNASYAAIGRALKDVREGRTPEVPLALRNSRTDLMKSEGYGAGYRYAHDDAPEGMNDHYLPEELRPAGLLRAKRHGGRGADQGATRAVARGQGGSRPPGVVFRRSRSPSKVWINRCRDATLRPSIGAAREAERWAFKPIERERQSTDRGRRRRTRHRGGLKP